MILTKNLNKYYIYICYYLVALLILPKYNLNLNRINGKFGCLLLRLNSVQFKI